MSLATHSGWSTVKYPWNPREILCLPMKYHVYPWSWSELEWRYNFTKQFLFANRTALEVKNIRHLCAVFAFRRIATITSGWNIAFVGQTSHFCKYQVKLRHSTNTKLNFDVGNAGNIYRYIGMLPLLITVTTRIATCLGTGITTKIFISYCYLEGRASQHNSISWS